MPCKLAISSMSLGRCAAGHSLPHRLDMAQEYGYQGIELFDEDLEDVALNPIPHSSEGVSMPTEPSSPDALLENARRIYQMCEDRNLKIIALQPFRNYEGLIDRAEHERLIEKLKLWIELAHELHTDLISIPSSFLPASQVSDDMNRIVADLQEAAEVASQAEPPIKLSYESLAWGTRSDTWETSWDIVQAVNRDNFGLCLDTFNIAARVYADPTSPTGTTTDAIWAVQRSMDRLVSRIDTAKIFLVQVVDGERLKEPLVEGHEFHVEGQPARMSWSRNCRLFYREQKYDAYLPVKKIALAIFQGLGYEGWVSLELFNRMMNDPAEDVPRLLAERGAESWRRIGDDMGWSGK